MIKAGRILMLIGGICAVLAIAVGGGFAINGFKHLHDVTNSEIATFTGRTNIQVAEGQEFSIWVPYPLIPDSNYCTVTRPDGSVLTEIGTGSTSITVDGRSWEASGYYKAEATEELYLSCRNLHEYRVGEPLKIVPFMAGIFGLVGGILGGLLFGVVLIVGLILFLSGKKRMQQTQQSNQQQQWQQPSQQSNYAQSQSSNQGLGQQQNYSQQQPPNYPNQAPTYHQPPNWQ